MQYNPFMHRCVIYFCRCNRAPDPVLEDLKLKFFCFLNVILGQVGLAFCNIFFTEFPVLPSTRETKLNKTWSQRDTDVHRLFHNNVREVCAGHCGLERDSPYSA